MLELRDSSFRRIAALMHETAGMAFGDHKKPLVASRLGPRLQRLGLADYDEYFDLILADDGGGEFQMALDLLTTNETYFFREPAHFDLLVAEWNRRGPRSPAIWSAASSFGDEAYTIAMLADEAQQAGRIGPDWRVLGTDISDRVLRAAVEAVYPAERLRHVDAARLRRHCLRGEGGAEGLVQMKPHLRAHVSFGRLNLMQPIEPLGPFDAVFLRNVLIYFDTETKAAVTDRVLEQLRPGGLFFIGTAEGRVPCRTPLEPLAPGAFRKAAA